MTNNKISGWLIYKKEDLNRNKRFISFLLNAAKQHDMVLTVNSLEEVQWTIHTNNSPFKDDCIPSFVVNRSVSPWLNELIELSNVRVFNTSYTSRIANDKRLTHAYFKNKGTPFLETVVIHKAALVKSGPGLAYPYIVKDPTGRGGTGVYKIKSKEDLMLQLHTLPNELIVQPLAKVVGRDLRVYIIGNKIAAAVLREAANEEDFRANLSTGGSSSMYELNKEEKYQIQQLCTGLKLDFVGLDFLFDSQGKLLFNEMEDAVGCRSLYMNSTIDIAEIFMQHIRKTMDMEGRL